MMQIFKAMTATDLCISWLTDNNTNFPLETMKIQKKNIKLGREFILTY